MPVLVEVQRHLDQLPETMAGLDAGIVRLSLLIEQMLPSMDGAWGQRRSPSGGTRPGQPPRESGAWSQKPPIGLEQVEFRQPAA